MNPSKPCKILCVCRGNADRSPAMAAILDLFLTRAGANVICDSAGLTENAANGGPAPQHVVTAGRRIGIDLSRHRRKHISSLPLSSYDLIITVDDDVAAAVVKAGVLPEMIYNANIPNPWPVQFQEDYDQTFGLILATMYRVVSRYYP